VMPLMKKNTNYQNPKCFARSVKNCSKKISGEHIISEIIMKFLFPNNLYLSGPKWLKDQENKNIPISSLTANVLCKTHNSALAKFDTQMNKLVRYLYTIEEEQVEKLNIDGYDIER
jgi:hypothetical protein